MNEHFDPEEVEVRMGVKLALLELGNYAVSKTIDDALGTSVDRLVAAGALSQQSANFIAKHQAQFYGFNSNRHGHDVPVLEVVLCQRTPVLRIVGLADMTVSVCGEI